MRTVSDKERGKTLHTHRLDAASRCMVCHRHSDDIREAESDRVVSERIEAGRATYWLH